MKKIIAILLAMLLTLTLCLSLTACSNKTGDDKAADQSAAEEAEEEEETEAPTEPQNGIGTVCHWEDATLEVTDITDDLSELTTTDTNDAKGKYVTVVLTVTDGQFSAGTMTELAETVKLDDYTQTKTVATGIKIDGDFENASIAGKVYILYDVPEDYSIEDGVVTVEGAEEE